MVFRNTNAHFLQIFNMSSFRDAKEVGQIKDHNVLKSQMYMFSRQRTAEQQGLPTSVVSTFEQMKLCSSNYWEKVITV